MVSIQGRLSRGTGGDGQVNVPCCVPVEVDRVAGAGPDQVPLVAGWHFVSVGKSDGLDTAGGVDGPEPDQCRAGQFVVLEVGSDLDTGRAVVGFD